MNDSLADALNSTGKFAIAQGVEPPPGLVIVCDGEDIRELEAGFASSMFLKPCNCALCMEAAGFTRQEIEASGWAELELLAKEERLF